RKESRSLPEPATQRRNCPCCCFPVSLSLRHSAAECVTPKAGEDESGFWGARLHNPHVELNAAHLLPPLARPGAGALGSTRCLLRGTPPMSGEGRAGCFTVKRLMGWRYISCGGHHSIMSENRKQYLSTLQQKEVTVQHLKAKLKESESKLRERDMEIEELKAQLGRMKEDWFEEEREIKELKQVIESMKNSLAQKEKKIQKYFIDISIEKKKLEALLQSMEVAWSSSVRDDQSLEHTCDSEGKPSALCALCQTASAQRTQLWRRWQTVGCCCSMRTHSAVNQEMLENVLGENLTSSQEEEKISNVMVEQATQTDIGSYSLDVEWLIQNIFRAPDACPLSPPSSLKELGEFSLGSFSDSGIIVDLTPSDPNSAILLSPVEPPCRMVKHGIKESHFVKELDFEEPHDDEAFGYVSTASQTEIKGRYWDSSLSSQRPSGCSSPCCTNYRVGFQYSGGTNPIYNIRAQLCDRCLVALHSLCRTPFSIKT
uniref:Syntabulin n=1 Tax=Otus sunia TaxID=257818 RepID=A0A8C8BFV3_9STRI